MCNAENKTTNTSLQALKLSKKIETSKQAVRKNWARTMKGTSRSCPIGLQDDVLVGVSKDD